MVASIEPGQRVDRYVVERVLGEGGMAVVYRVRHETLGTPHALKVLTIGNKGIQQRLVQEGRVQATLRHANIVAVTDVLVHEGAPALLMEFIEGPSMDRLLAQYRPTVQESVALFRAVVTGVKHAHNKGLIHRDLKPANVMLDLTDGVTPKVTDFGLAKATDGGGSGNFSKTRTGTTMGTPAYMPPEQIRDASSVDKRADVYALGAILFELVCGRPAFVADDIITLLTDVAAGKRADPKALAGELPESILAVIDRAMNPVAAERLPDCEAILAILDADPTFPRHADHERLAVNSPLTAATRALGANTPSPAEARSQPTWGGDVAASNPSGHAPPVSANQAPGRSSSSRGPTSKGPTSAKPVTAPTMMASPDGGTDVVPGPTPSRAPVANPSITSLSPFPTQSLPPQSNNRGMFAVAGAAIVIAMLFAVTVGVVGAMVALSKGAGTQPAVVVVPMAPKAPPPEAKAPEKPPAVAKPPPVPEKPPEVAVSTEPPPEPPPEALPEPPPEVTVAEAPKTVVTVPKAVVTKQATGTVTVAGDAQKVRLSNGKDELSPDQPIPVGTWQVKAWFDGPEPVGAGKVVVTADKPVTIKCNAMMLQCRVL